MPGSPPAATERTFGETRGTRAPMWRASRAGRKSQCFQVTLSPATLLECRCRDVPSPGSLLECRFGDVPSIGASLECRFGGVPSPGASLELRFAGCPISRRVTRAPFPRCPISRRLTECRCRGYLISRIATGALLPGCPHLPAPHSIALDGDAPRLHRNPMVISEVIPRDAIEPCRNAHPLATTGHVRPGGLPHARRKTFMPQRLGQYHVAGPPLTRRTRPGWCLLIRLAGSAPRVPAGVAGGAVLAWVSRRGWISQPGSTTGYCW